MSRFDSSHSVSVGSLPTVVSFLGSASGRRTDSLADNSYGAESSLRIAVPTAGSAPSFDNVYTLAVTGALLDQEVLVVCMTDEMLAGWRRRLRERSWPLEGLTLLDGQFGWSVNWRAFFCYRSYDITVMHGIHVALKEQRISPSYAGRLVNAVPSGLLVLA